MTLNPCPRRNSREPRDIGHLSCWFQAEDGIRDRCVTGVQTCAFSISSRRRHTRSLCDWSSDVCSSDLVSRLQRELNDIQRTIRSRDTFPFLKEVQTLIDDNERRIVDLRARQAELQQSQADRKSVV